MKQKKILLASPRGFCAGVARAVAAVEETLRICGTPVYVKHEIVHNRHVVADLERKGAITIEAACGSAGRFGGRLFGSWFTACAL